MIITRKFLHNNAAAHTRYGNAWTAAQVEVLGLRYPLRKGWMRQVVGKTLTDEQASQFINAREILRHCDRKQIRKDRHRVEKKKTGSDYPEVTPEFLAALERDKTA